METPLRTVPVTSLMAPEKAMITPLQWSRYLEYFPSKIRHTKTIHGDKMFEQGFSDTTSDITI